MACSSCGKKNSALQVSVEKRALNIHGKTYTLPNGKQFKMVHDPEKKNKLTSIRLN
jgi:hypothetical protein